MMDKVGVKNFYSQNATWADEVTITGDQEKIEAVKKQALNHIAPAPSKTPWITQTPRVTDVWWGPTGASRRVVWGQETFEMEYFTGQFDATQAKELFSVPIN